jgi:hypothetical protein
MGQLRLVGPDAAAAFETLIPVDVIDLPVGKQRYGLLLNDDGGIIDDLMFFNKGNNEIFVIVNGACKIGDIAHIQYRIGHRCEVIAMPERALLALQGPQAVTALSRLAPGVEKLVFMSGGNFTVNTGTQMIDVFLTRSGYTGEDGFEISVHNDQADALARALLAREADSVKANQALHAFHDAFVAAKGFEQVLLTSWWDGEMATLQGLVEGVGQGEHKTPVAGAELHQMSRSAFGQRATVDGNDGELRIGFGTGWPAQKGCGSTGVTVQDKACHAFFNNHAEFELIEAAPAQAGIIEAPLERLAFAAVSQKLYGIKVAEFGLGFKQAAPAVAVDLYITLVLLMQQVVLF